MDAEDDFRVMNAAEVKDFKPPLTLIISCIHHYTVVTCVPVSIPNFDGLELTLHSVQPNHKELCITFAGECESQLIYLSTRELHLPHSRIQSLQ